ncbi:indolepyruvate ferredoxin oxidoreductase subunit alpha [Clostridium aminobutyricum]|nr:4Fe-4S binding protein [Clostridium aminobutyricum]
MLKEILSHFNKDGEEKLKINPIKHPYYYYQIDPNKCRGCGACKKVCKAKAVDGEHRKIHVIDKEKCIQCGVCMKWCRFKAINESDI